jgi:hypothetical protein
MTFPKTPPRIALPPVRIPPMRIQTPAEPFELTVLALDDSDILAVDDSDERPTLPSI